MHAWQELIGRQGQRRGTSDSRHVAPRVEALEAAAAAAHAASAKLRQCMQIQQLQIMTAGHGVPH